MYISAKADYATRVLLTLAAEPPGTAITGERLAAMQDLPAKFVENTLVELRRAGLVHSQRGRDGGYRLGLPASEISIARVMRVEQGFLAEVHGQRPEDVAYPGAAAPLASVWVAAREAYRRVLEDVTLADVVAGKLPGPVAELVALDDAWRSFGDAPGS